MELRRCQPFDLQAVVDLNETVYAALPDKTVLRHNDAAMIATCLEEPNVTLGIWDGDLLVAIGMLYVPQCLKEDHFHDLGLQGDYHSANQKLFLVREGYRGLGLQRKLIREVEQIATARGFNLLCTTVAPNNTFSINSFLKEGYVYAKTEEKYGGLTRNLYYKKLNVQPMFQEIERKFLVIGDYKAEAYVSTDIRQGYLCGGSGVTVRVRQRGDKGYLTIKGPRSLSGLSRFEWEKEITGNDAQALLALAQGGLVEKTRHLVRNTDGRHTWEVDEFHGANEGLVVAEIELSSENDPFDRPDWLGQEVSDDPRYYNSQLLKHPYNTWK